mgnify:CR=1 FL=1
MLDIKFVRENPEAVRENIRKKFQDAKLPLVDEAIDCDARLRAAITEANELRASRNALSKKVGMLMGQAKKDPSKLEEAEAVKAQVKADAWPRWKPRRQSWRKSCAPPCSASRK